MTPRASTCVCVVPLATYNAHPNDASLDTSCDIHVGPGSHECGEPGRAIGRIQAFSFVAFKVQVWDFFLAGGGQPLLTPSSPNRSLGAYLLWRSQFVTKTDTISTAVCRPFTFHCSVSGYISGGRCDHRPCTRMMTTSICAGHGKRTRQGLAERCGLRTEHWYITSGQTEYAADCLTREGRMHVYSSRIEGGCSIWTDIYDTPFASLW